MIVVLYLLARRKLRLSTFVFLGILAVFLAPEAQTPHAERLRGRPVGATTGAPPEDVDLAPAALDARLARFYAEQKQSSVPFAHPGPDDPPFDILILHMCSLSWDDLRDA